MVDNYDSLDSMQQDALREIGNIGTGNAVTSLSSMLMREVNIRVPQISFLDYNVAVDKMGGPENMMVGILLSLSKDVRGIIMFLLEQDFAGMALGTLLGNPELGKNGKFVGVDEMERSALCEVGNIMAASYVNAIAQFTNLEIDISVPDVCVDMVGAIMNVPAVYFADISDKIMFIQNEFECEDEQIKSHILMMPDSESLKAILVKLGVVNG